jgi:hypothetical protein
MDIMLCSLNKLSVHFLCRKENEPKENAASVSSLKPEGRKTPILGLKFE